MRFVSKSWLCALVLLSACDRSSEDAPAASAAKLSLDDAQLRAALATYADIARASYDDSAASAQALLVAVRALVAAPSEATLLAAQRAWLASRVPYAQTEAFRFYDGPIDGVEGFINAWPIDESYADAIIADAAKHPELTPQLLQAQNEREGETAISAGFHVIEYLLWGRDDNAEGPGTRAFTDYVASASDPIPARRARYLVLATELLVEQLQGVARAWSSEGASSYRTRWQTQAPSASLALAIRGLGTLTGPELSGERLTVAYETKDQENEHSCFSDSTSVDLAGSALGIENLCEGRYRRVDGTAITGTGLCALFGELGMTLRAQCAASVGALRAIPAPFDRAILGTDDAPGRKAIKSAIDALQAQATALSEVAQALDLGVGDTPKQASP